MNQTNNIATTNNQDLKSGINIALLVYILQIVGFFLGGITFLIGVIINYVKKSDVEGTFVASHFRWQVRTFWYGLLWGVIGGLLLFIYIGIPILAINCIWIIYRVVRGVLRLGDKKEMY